MKDLVTGILKTSYGVHGQVKAKLLSGSGDHLFIGQRVVLAHPNLSGKDIEVEISDIKDSNGDIVILRFNGLDSPEEVRKYNGWEIWISREAAPSLDDEEYYHADLVGCDMYMIHDGGTELSIGSVISVIDGMQADILEVRRSDGRLVYIPFLDLYIGAVDIDSRRIELKDERLLME